MTPSRLANRGVPRISVGIALALFCAVGVYYGESNLEMLPITGMGPVSAIIVVHFLRKQPIRFVKHFLIPAITGAAASFMIILTLYAYSEVGDGLASAFEAEAVVPSALMAIGHGSFIALVAEAIRRRIESA